MIIPRKYEWLGVLYQNDLLSKNAIDKAFAQLGINDNRKKELLEYNHCSISAFMDLGCGIPGECYSNFMKAFEKLDCDIPYDNGLSFNDVSSIEYETSRKGKAIQMRFVSQKCELPLRIVGFASLENTDGEIQINKGWQMTNPFVIG